MENDPDQSVSRTVPTGGGDSAIAPQQPKHDSKGAADLEKVTDYAEEKEISNDTNLNEAITAITDKRRKDADLKAEREKKLASVKIKKEDVELICNEFEVSRTRAEHILKENNGDLTASLTALINA